MKPILTIKASEDIAEEFKCYPNFRTDNEDFAVIEDCNFEPLFAVPKDIEPDDLRTRLEQCDKDLKKMVADEEYILSKLKKMHQTKKVPTYKIVGDEIITHYVDAPEFEYY